MLEASLTENLRLGASGKVALFSRSVKMIDIAKTREEVEKIKNEASEKLLKLDSLEKEIKKQQKDLEVVSNSISEQLGDFVDKEKFMKFFEKPYVILPQTKTRVLVAVPKFIQGFQVGWLWKETDQFYIYQLDQYSSWLGDVPTDLLKEIDFKKEFEAQVVGNQVLFEPSNKDEIKRKLAKHIGDVTDTSARILRGHEFEIIADMVENGCLPFKPSKVSQVDLRNGESNIKLRPYQKPAFDKFLEVGSIGLFHPTGAGKSIVSMKALDVIKGKKLIVVPSKTLVEQWNYYLDTYLAHCKNEIEIKTYQGYRGSDEEYALVIFDECQRLPANSFSRLALIKTKYRIGLSASPHREDKRESYIFALTGFPVGLNWQDYMKDVGKSYHPIFVHIVRGEVAKLKKAESLVDMNKRTFVFCDSIELGKRMADQINVPYIYGQTENRMDMIDKNRVVVVSRVADLGVSVKDLRQVIEIDFLFGSRQQELQRTGRLMHSEEKDVRHDIIMTEKEFESYGKRLWALQEKGFTIKVLGGK